MTIKEAILKSLENKQSLMTHWDILKNIQENSYYDFSNAKTPETIISSELGNFIRKNDNRVNRIKRGKSYSYYLSKYKDELILNDNSESTKTTVTNNYYERDLHPLLASYLNSKKILSKTIFHEESNRKDSNQKWIHPDIIGIEFLTLKTEVTQQFIKALNITDTFKMTSYELKREIQTDHELKKSYFQAVSNSSWANYGYLVAFEIERSLLEEMERLNQSFGIGIIELKANPFESKILFSSKYRELDFKTIDKLSNLNNDFKKFITYIEEIITSKGKNHKRAKKEFEADFCDKCLSNDTEIEIYCKSKNIPFDEKN